MTGNLSFKDGKLFVTNIICCKGKRSIEVVEVTKDVAKAISKYIKED